jgi:hypothetical protein
MSENQSILEDEGGKKKRNEVSQGSRILVRNNSIFDGKEYQKISLEDPTLSEKENKYHCFIHYSISNYRRTLHIQTFVCNAEPGEGSELLLNLLNNLIETEELDPRAQIELTADADAASFFVTKDILIDQTKLEEFYKKLLLKQKDKDKPEFRAYVGPVTQALNKRRKSSPSEPSIFQLSILDQSELPSSIFKPKGGKRTRKYRKIKTRKYKKSGSKTRSSPQN